MAVVVKKKLKRSNKTTRKRQRKYIKRRSGTRKCLGKRDGISGCRTCCTRKYKKKYSRCVSRCMRH